jgi:predicted site-specific integrase-resolvase
MEGKLIERQALIKELNINPSTLWRWEKSGKIKRAGGIGNKVYYSRRHIEYVITKNN